MHIMLRSEALLSEFGYILEGQFSSPSIDNLSIVINYRYLLIHPFDTEYGVLSKEMQN